MSVEDGVQRRQCDYICAKSSGADSKKIDREHSECQQAVVIGQGPYTTENLGALYITQQLVLPAWPWNGVPMRSVLL